MGCDVTFSQAQSAAHPALPTHAPGVAVAYSPSAQRLTEEMLHEIR